jgi:NAD(P)-dependent dehydrogenase (short-subunit alcohol dehydrogenase family)
MRSVLITGCRSGIGLEFVKQLLKHETAKPEILIATCRKIEDAPVIFFF